MDGRCHVLHSNESLHANEFLSLGDTTSRCPMTARKIINNTLVHCTPEFCKLIVRTSIKVEGSKALWNWLKNVIVNSCNFFVICVIAAGFANAKVPETKGLYFYLLIAPHISSPPKGNNSWTYEILTFHRCWKLHWDKLKVTIRNELVPNGVYWALGRVLKREMFLSVRCVVSRYNVPSLCNNNLQTFLPKSCKIAVSGMF